MTKQELNKLVKDYPSEFADISAHELKLLLAYRMQLQGVTRWDVFMDEFVDALKHQHHHYLLELGIDSDEKEKEVN